MTTERRQLIGEIIFAGIWILAVGLLVNLKMGQRKLERDMQQQYEIRLKESSRVRILALANAGLDHEQGVVRPLSVNDFISVSGEYELRPTSQKDPIRDESADAIRLKSLDDVEAYVNVYNYYLEMKVPKVAPMQGEMAPNK